MKNIASSVRARLANVAKANGDAFQDVLQRYANERILHRLSKSEYREDFVLKGAVLFVMWTGKPHRSTKDLDLLSRGDFDESRLQEVMATVLEAPVDPDDGLLFSGKEIRVSKIREDKRYGGLRVITTAKLAGARIPVQIDVGFGDAARPEVQEMHSLLDLPPPVVRAYTPYEVVAEKVEAMIQLQTSNSRMKDFFDVRYLAEHFEFEGARLGRAIRDTSQRRQTILPPEGVSELFSRLRARPEKLSQWAGFLKKALPTSDWTYEESLEKVQRFVDVPLQHAASGKLFEKSWPAGGPWIEKKSP